MQDAGFDLTDESNRPQNLSKADQLKLTEKLLKGEVSDSLRRVSKMADLGGISQTSAMANLTKRIQ